MPLNEPVFALMAILLEEVLGDVESGPELVIEAQDAFAAPMLPPRPPQVLLLRLGMGVEQSVGVKTLTVAVIFVCDERTAVD